MTALVAAAQQEAQELTGAGPCAEQDCSSMRYVAHEQLSSLVASAVQLYLLCACSLRVGVGVAILLPRRDPALDHTPILEVRPSISIGRKLKLSPLRREALLGTTFCLRFSLTCIE